MYKAIQRRTRLFSSLAMLLCLCCAAPAATNIFVGGGGDEYDEDGRHGTIGNLQIGNAEGATNVTATSAWLNGILVATSNGETAVVRVYWGAADGGTNWENWAQTNDFGSIAEGLALTTNVTGLTANTTYYYRFYATNAAGQVWAWPAASFVMAGPPVVNTGGGAIHVRETTAVLQGVLTAGASAGVLIYYGTDTNNWSNTNTIGTVVQGATFSTSVTGLTASTEYYYRCYATNAYGTNYAQTPFATAEPTMFAGGNGDAYALYRFQVTLTPDRIGTILSIW